ncbi:DUF3035 domain-containing protein [Roseovarius sp. MMSF_3281]|uniref:DUF3035 domain-containing protein n=1 Tax=Roseovarius sp. MMSF_3281 TaxID=3046694 RepID=UPI00273F8647|nr:DUF3035 domain-containing protein [Roseovarius sp. MMSF_3281]
MVFSRVTILVVVLGVLAGCSNRGDDIQLRRIDKPGEGPDEFAILPGKELQAPEDYASLPAPTPGSANLSDQNPKADGVAALGGNRAALAVGAASQRDAGLVQHTSRYGVQSGIRQTLAQEDKEVRRRHGRVNILRLGPTDDYTDAYKRQWLNSHAEQRRLRRLGIETPSAPPPATE